MSVKYIQQENETGEYFFQGEATEIEIGSYVIEGEIYNLSDGDCLYFTQNGDISEEPTDAIGAWRQGDNLWVIKHV
jgi:hypothetical protein